MKFQLSRTVLFGLVFTLTSVGAVAESGAIPATQWGIRTKANAIPR